MSFKKSFKLHFYPHTEDIKDNVTGKQKRHSESKDFTVHYTGNAQHFSQAQHFKRHKLFRHLPALPTVWTGPEVLEEQVLFQNTAEDSKAFGGLGCSIPIKFSARGSFKSSTKPALVQIKVVEHFAHDFANMDWAHLSLILSIAAGQHFLPTNKAVFSSLTCQVQTLVDTSFETERFKD